MASEYFIPKSPDCRRGVLCMKPEDIDYLVKYNELKDDVEHRLLLKFESSHTVILLNDSGLPLLPHITTNLNGSTFNSIIDPRFAELVGIGLPNVPNVLEFSTSESIMKPKSWVVHYDGSKLLIPVKSGPPQKLMLPPAVGIVITGKQNIFRGSKILGTYILDKNTPTPFLADEWGDSWNDSFDLEPRIIESVPSTVFNCVSGILSAAKLAFSASQYAVAASKYRKAFHYCHKYYPETLSPEDLETATDLKIKSLLNLSLAGLKANTIEWLTQSIEACGVLLGMPECTGLVRAKALYRLGSARVVLGDEKLAKHDFELSLAEHDDPQTRAMLKKCDSMQRERELKLKQNISKAFFAK